MRVLGTPVQCPRTLQVRGRDWWPNQRSSVELSRNSARPLLKQLNCRHEQRHVRAFSHTGYITSNCYDLGTEKERERERVELCNEDIFITLALLLE